MKQFNITALFSAFILAGTLQAQELPKAFGRTVQSVHPTTGLVRCASTEYETFLQAKNSKRQTTEQFEQWLAPKVAEIKAKKALGRSAATDDEGSTVLQIPVVVHVIHNGDAVGSNENIADEQVISQITVLNQDYRKMADTPGWNDNPVGADMEIEFVLALRDPEGNATNGIDRVNLSRASWTSEDLIESTLKPQTSWDPAQYFNIWVCNFGGSMSDILGYAQFPSGSTLGGVDTDAGDADTDGVIIGYKYFGSEALYPGGTYDGTYNGGRTATHEIGHCFGLRHVDGDNTSCTVNATDSRKDYCPDTPAITELHYECTSEDSCPGDDGIDMIENYMDYTNDSCMNIFTQDQKGRLQAVMANSPRRAELPNSPALLAPETTAGIATNTFNGTLLYPNPASSTLNIALGSTVPDSYIIYNSIGQTVATGAISGTAAVSINTAAYSNGMYFVKLSKGSQSKTLTFIKN